MGQFLLLVVVALTVGAVVFGVTVLLTGGDPGLSAAEPDGRAVPLPGTRPLVEDDIEHVRFDTALRGYRMAQVDQAMRRAAYDIGYKDELINVLEAEVAALRSGRFPDAEVLRRAREAARSAAGATAEPTTTADSSTETDSDAEATAGAAVTAGAVEAADPAAVEPTASDPLVAPTVQSGDDSVVGGAAEGGPGATGADADSSPVESPVESPVDSSSESQAEPHNPPAAGSGKPASTGSDLGEPVEAESDLDGAAPESGVEAADATSGSDPSSALPSRR
jgi:DivIVA domain-containing protein